MERDKDRFLWIGIGIGTVAGLAMGHLGVGVLIGMLGALGLGRIGMTAKH